ncbi:hypothetical protein [Streptomyces sp. NBC_01264]|uniref:hypothetical protein n=1 Tax=Streptomyces sp. NBC_01264 TaxID=2903804 RepID=UPI00224F9F89|nr:hypothetical protein [Streptomyces sp. NBC_01264]MCX4778202.1 hypothetical protein [Streptomyces sp. NBC_01264]
MDALRQSVFASQDYYWEPWGDDEDEAGGARPRPATLDLLLEDEQIQTEGTHSILDVYRVLGPGEEPEYCTVEPVGPDEARRVAGTERLTREHVPAMGPLASRRWFGRCAVLHDAAGHPEEIYFWGFSGD